MRIHQKVVYLWDYDKGGCYVNFFLLHGSRPNWYWIWRRLRDSGRREIAVYFIRWCNLRRQLIPVTAGS